MGIWGYILPLVVTPVVMAAAWFSAKRPSHAVFVPTNPQLFRFKRNSPVSSANGAASGGKDSPTNGPVAAGGVDDEANTELLSIQSVLETRVPSALAEYRPSWWLPNGHAQTAYVIAGNFSKVDQVVYERCAIPLLP